MKENVNSKGNLTIGGCDSVELANKYGTPLYVMDETVIRDNCRIYKDAIERFYNGKGLAFYASKALSCKALYRIIKDEGLGIDVVSKGELFTALSINFPTNKILFHGNNKSYDELNYAIENNVYRIVVDNFEEIELINEISEKKNKKTNVLLRVTPGIEAHTHSFVKTGQIDSKFGFSLETGQAGEAVKILLSRKNISLKGLHCHIGSQIFDMEPFVLATKVMLRFLLDMKNVHGIEFSELNIGGGFGVKYTEKDISIDYAEYIRGITCVIKDICRDNGLTVPFLMFEPGRSIVGDAGVTLYKVGHEKIIPGVRNYLTVDGGMSDNPRYILYASKYYMTIANKADIDKTDKYTIAGKCCESGDILGEDVLLQKPEKDDILAVFGTGAYNYSMSSNYNRIVRPGIIMAKNGNYRIAVKPEDLEDIIRNDV